MVNNNIDYNLYLKKNDKNVKYNNKNYCTYLFQILSVTAANLPAPVDIHVQIIQTYNFNIGIILYRGIIGIHIIRFTKHFQIIVDHYYYSLIYKTILSWSIKYLNHVYLLQFGYNQMIMNSKKKKKCYNYIIIM